MAAEKTVPGSRASRRRRAIADLWVIAGLASAAFAGLAAIDGFERFAVWSRAHETWQLDELLMLTGVTTVSAAVFAARRWRELVAEIRLREASDAAVKRLEGILPICSFCKRIRDDDGTWTAVESYVRTHAAVEFSHGFCEECGARHYQYEGPSAQDITS